MPVCLQIILIEANIEGDTANCGGYQERVGTRFPYTSKKFSFHMVEQMSSVSVDCSLSLVFNVQLILLVNRRHWEEAPNYNSNAYSQLSKPRTNIEVARKGFDGDIIGFKEVIIDDPNLASNNSTSFSRAFGSTKDFVRGSAAQFPFAPGGLEAEVVIDDDVLNNSVDLEADIDFFDVEGICRL